MYNKDKVILMTKLAVYDKSRGSSDRKKHSFFRSDYVYRQNMWMRFYLAIGLVCVFVFYVLHRLAFAEFNVYTIDWQAEGLKLAYAVLVVMLAYTVIGTVIYTFDYERAGNRQKRYIELLSRLDRKPKPRPEVNTIDMDAVKFRTAGQETERLLARKAEEQKER